MSSIFTKIIAGEIPGNFVWADEQCVAITTIEPCSPGHVMVIPRLEVDNFVDADPALIQHLFTVAQTIGKAAVSAFGVARAGIVVAGFDVPHLHIHVIPADTMGDMNMIGVKMGEGEAIRAAALRLRAALVDGGHGAFVPADVSAAAL
ncbi:MAG: HIT family protein [Actinomycetaceae bacterium]|nr:HIT family protein [Actinomycetaceae bacterium]